MQFGSNLNQVYRVTIGNVPLIVDLKFLHLTVFLLKIYLRLIF